MSFVRWITILVLAVTLAACKQTTTPTPIVSTPAQGDNTFAAGSSVVASGEVVPAQEARLAFTIVGRVKTVDVAEGDEVQAGQTIITLDTSILDAKVAEAEAALKAAQVQYDYLKRVWETPVRVDVAQADRDRAAAALASAQAALAQAALLSPIDGKVSLLGVTPGETVVPGQIVAVIGDVTLLEVETTDLSERDVPRVKAGQPAIIYVEALGQEIAGKVIEVAQQATIVGGDVVYKVTIALDEQLPDLRWGMSAEVEIKTGK